MAKKLEKKRNKKISKTEDSEQEAIEKTEAFTEESEFLGTTDSKTEHNIKSQKNYYVIELVSCKLK